MENSSTANSLNARLVPHDDFEGRTCERFGVGELIDLHPPAGSGDGLDLRWVVAGGEGTLYNLVGNNGQATFRCHHGAGTANLELRDTGSGNIVSRMNISTVTPYGATGVQVPGTGIRHTQNTFSVGFKMLYYLQPSDVSYSALYFSEGSTQATTTGSLAPLNVPHAQGMGVPINGCQVLGIDTVFSGYLNLQMITGPGTFLWPIPLQYSDRAGGYRTEFAVANHYAVSDAGGNATISKLSCGPYTKQAADPDSNY